MTEQNKQTCAVEINGKPYDAKAGQTIIQVADQHGVYIPRFCYHDKLSVVANCRMCLVEVANAPKPMPACATPVSDGMQVMTSSQKALSAQRAVMSFLLINHPLDCPVCDQGGSCELQDLSMGFGRGKSDFTLPKRAVVDKNIGPLIETHMTRCIHCTRCVRFGEEIAGMRELGATGRGEHMEIGTYVSKMVRSELSGNAIDICPVGALTSKPFAFSARHWELTQHPSISPHDGVGSNLYLHTRGDAYHAGRTVMKVIPRFQADINENWISDRDRFSYAALNSEQRLLAPEIKMNGAWQTVSWPEALDYVANELTQVIADHGSDKIAGLASAQCTTEGLYCFQTWLRGLGCSHIDFRSQQQDFSDDHCVPMAPTYDGDLDSIEHCDVFFLLGANVRQEQPMLNHRVRKAVLRGAKVISLHMMPYEANHALAHELVLGIEDMVYALAYWAAQCLGEDAPSQWSDYLAKAPQQDVLDAISVLWKEAKQAVLLFGAGACNHPYAATLRQLLACVQQHQACKVMSLATGPNVAGAQVAGVLPHRDVVGQRVSHPGDHATAMMSSAKQAYVLFNHEPEWDHANPDLAMSALKQASTVLCCTPFVTDVMRDYANVLLPVAPFGYEDGCYVNITGTWQTMQALPSEHAGMQQAWKVFKSLADMMSVASLDFTKVHQIREHLQSQTPAQLPKPSTEQPAWQWPTWENQAAKEGYFRCIVRTHMYHIDPLVRRSGPLQEIAKLALNTVYLHPDAIAKLGLTSDDSVTVHCHDQQLVLQYQSCAKLPKDSIVIYRRNGTQGALVQGDWLKVARGQ